MGVIFPQLRKRYFICLFCPNGFRVLMICAWTYRSNCSCRHYLNMMVTVYSVIFMKERILSEFLPHKQGVHCFSIFVVICAVGIWLPSLKASEHYVPFWEEASIRHDMIEPAISSDDNPEAQWYVSVCLVNPSRAHFQMSCNLAHWCSCPSCLLG